MKKYLLFAGGRYYPGGGMEDYRGSFDTIEDAQAAFNVDDTAYGDWAHIVDHETMAIVCTCVADRFGQTPQWRAVS